MSEVQSYIFDIKEVPTFFDDWNIKFQLMNMDGNTNQFRLIFSSYAPIDINDCLDGSGYLNSNVTQTASVDCCLKWDKDSRIIKIKNDTTWNIGDNNYPLRAVFLCNKANDYVLGYCIHNLAFNVTNKVEIKDGTILWSIV